jgi:hypothetical protein
MRRWLDAWVLFNLSKIADELPRQRPGDQSFGRFVFISGSM